MLVLLLLLKSHQTIVEVSDGSLDSGSEEEPESDGESALVEESMRNSTKSAPRRLH